MRVPDGPAASGHPRGVWFVREFVIEASGIRSQSTRDLAKLRTTTIPGCATLAGHVLQFCLPGVPAEWVDPERLDLQPVWERACLQRSAGGHARLAVLY